MSQPPASLEVVTPRDPEVEQAIPEVIHYGWKGSGLTGSYPNSDDGNVSLDKHKRICGMKRSLFYTIWALLALAVIGGSAGGLGGELMSLKRNSSNSSKSTPLATAAPDSVTGQASRGALIANASSASPPTVDSLARTSTLTSLSLVASASAPQVTTASTLTPAPSSNSSGGTTTVYASIGPPSINNQPSPSCLASSSSNGSVIIPQINSTNINYNGKAQRFQVLCNTNWPEGAMYGNPQVADFKSFESSNMNEFIMQCALWKGSGSTPLCVAAEVDVGAKHCALKNSTGLNVTRTSDPGDGAILLL